MFSYIKVPLGTREKIVPLLTTTKKRTLYYIFRFKGYL